MLTTKQKRFCDEYLVDFNATQACIRAGYSKDTAYSIGSENLRKPEIKIYIDKRLEELSMGPEQAKKLISDIAKSNLSDYFTTKKIEHTPRVKRSLKLLIQDLKYKIEFEDEFAEQAQLDEDSLAVHLASQKMRRHEIIRYEIELRRNPKAFRIVNGETIFVDTVELDLIKLAADKERGRIKSLSYSPDGRPKVELYASDTALSNIAKIHGLFKEDEKEKSLNISINGKEVKVS